MWPGGRISRVVDRLGAVAVGVEQEAAVVVVAVLGPRPRRAVVAMARVRAGAPERLDELARARAEGDVQPARHRVLASAAASEKSSHSAKRASL